MSNKKQSGGPGFSSVLALIFITLKLMHYIEWSWLWVLCPIWGTFAALLVIFFIALLVAALTSK